MEIKLSTTTCSVATVIFAIIAGYLVAFKAPANASAECVMSPLQSQYAALDTRGRVSFWEDRLANELEILPLNDQQQRIVKKVSQIISADLIEAAKKRTTSDKASKVRNLRPCRRRSLLYLRGLKPANFLPCRVRRLYLRP